MKKIKRLLALFASLAILTGGGILTSCSGGGGDGSDDDAPSAKLTFSGNNFNIDVSGEITDAEVSVKLSSVDFNETAMAAAADADISEYITVTPSAESDISITSIKLAEAITDKKVAKVKLSAKAGSNSVSGTLSFVIKGSILSSGKDLKVSKGIPYAIGEVGGDDVMGFLWTTKDAGLDGTTKASSKALEAKAYGPVTVVLDGTGTGVLITDVDGNDPAKVVPEPFKNTNTFGYVRLNAGGAGGEKAKKALKFKVPKTTTKISVYAKSGSSKGNANVTISDAEGNVLISKEIDNSDYQTVEYVPAFSGDTLLYLFNDAADAGLNLKAIYVDEPAVELSSIEISANPEKTEYALNDDLNTTGLKIKATYSNGKSKTVTGWEVSGYDKAKKGEQTITVSYKEGEITKTATFTVTVKIKALVSIAVKTNPTKTAYLVGDKVDLSGLVLTLTYDDKSESTVEYTAEKAADFTSDFDSSTAAESKEVKVTYGGKTTATGFTVKITAPVYFSGLNVSSDEFENAVKAAGITVNADAKTNINTKVAASDGSWEMEPLNAGNIVLNAESGSAWTSYDGTNVYTKRIDSNAKGVKIKLRVKPNEEKILRLDSRTTGSGKEVEWTFKGESEVKIKHTEKATNFVTLKPDSDGYITVTSNLENKANIFGIYVVSAAVEPSVVTGAQANTKYSEPVITLKSGENVLAADTVVAPGTTLTASATTTPTELWTNGVFKEGTAITAFTFTLKNSSGTVVENAVNGSTITLPSNSETYTLTASYTAEGEESPSATGNRKIVVADTSVTHTVTFDLNYEGATGAPESQNVTAGSKAKKPTPDPSRGDTYTFGGWYKETTCENSFNFDTDAVTGPLTLYAKWNAVSTGNSTGVWNFKERTVAPAGANAWDASTALTNDVVLAADSGTGSFTVLKGAKAKYNTGLQFSNGSVAKNLFNISGNGKVKITYNAPSDATTSKPFVLYAEGDESNKITADTGKPSGTYELTIYGETKFYSNDCRILSVTFTE